MTLDASWVVTQTLMSWGVTSCLPRNSHYTWPLRPSHSAPWALVQATVTFLVQRPPLSCCEVSQLGQLRGRVPWRMLGVLMGVCASGQI